MYVVFTVMEACVTGRLMMYRYMNMPGGSGTVPSYRSVEITLKQESSLIQQPLIKLVRVHDCNYS